MAMVDQEWEATGAMDSRDKIIHMDRPNRVLLIISNHILGVEETSIIQVEGNLKLDV